MINNFRELSLGKKIKMLRIERKITQQELVGDYITRNMLSQIENDAASPSIGTLEFIADRLGVPMSYLMQTDHDGDYGAEFETADSISARAKKLFLSGDYAAFAEMAEKSPEILEEYEELKLMLGLAYLDCAGKSFGGGKMRECLEHCRKAQKLDFGRCGPAAREIKKRADLYKKLCDAESSDGYMFLSEVLDADSLCKYNIVCAKQALSAGGAARALEYLQEAELIIKGSAGHPYLGEIYKAFESCYVALEDYKSAHHYSSLLLSIYAGK